MKIYCPIPKLLLPVDGSEDSKRAVEFAGCLGGFLGKGLSAVMLLRVLAGGYLSRHLGNIDHRAADLVKSDTFQKLRDEHITQNIQPMLDSMENILKGLGIEAEIKKQIEEGDPPNEILRIAQERKYTTIIMARRGTSSESKGSPLGSVTSKVIHTATKQTVYIVGHKVLADKACPIPRILIPVDGSTYSMKGVEHAVCLASSMKEAFGGITLLRVVNLALFMERLKAGSDPEEESRKILDKSKDMFIEAGIPENLVTTKIRTGKPADEIVKESLENDYSLVIIGRKGRSALKEMLLGGVSSTVIEKCNDPTFAVVSTA